MSRRKKGESVTNIHNLMYSLWNAYHNGANWNNISACKYSKMFGVSNFKKSLVETYVFQDFPPTREQAIEFRKTLSDLANHKMQPNHGSRSISIDELVNVLRQVNITKIIL